VCGRYALFGPKSRSLQLKKDVTARERALIQKFIDEYLKQVAPRYNIAPQQGNPKNFVPIVRRGEGGGIELALVQWWLLPYWSKEPRIKHSTFNARIETVRSLASFREAFKRRRCLIPASGWYEWQELPSGNLPWFLHPAQDDYVFFAGLWDRWEMGEQVIESCAIIVGPADETSKPYHDRAPYTVADEDIGAWLDPALQDADAAMKLLRPFGKGQLGVHRVDKRVNRATIDEPGLVEPIPEEG